MFSCGSIDALGGESVDVFAGVSADAFAGGSVNASFIRLDVGFKVGGVFVGRAVTG